MVGACQKAGINYKERGAAMARTHQPDTTDLRFFANMIHHAFTSTRKGATTRHMFSILIDRSAVMGPLELLGLSPLHEIKTAKVGDQYFTVPFPGSDLVVWPFTILSDPIEVIRNMTLPRGTVAFGTAIEMQVKITERGDQTKLVELTASGNGSKAYSTMAVGRGGTKVSLMTLDGLDEVKKLDAYGDLVIAMREAIIRSAR